MAARITGGRCPLSVDLWASDPPPGDPPPNYVELELEYGRLIEAQWPRLMAMCMARGRSRPEAEDIVAEAFLRLYERRRTINAPAPYLRKIVANLLTRRRPEEPREEAGAAASSGASEVVELEGQQLIQSALNQLVGQQRDVFALHLADYTTRQIALLLGSKPSTVRSHLRHARTKLAVWWTAEGEER